MPTQALATFLAFAAKHLILRSCEPETKQKPTEYKESHTEFFDVAFVLFQPDGFLTHRRFGMLFSCRFTWYNGEKTSLEETHAFYLLPRLRTTARAEGDRR